MITRLVSGGIRMKSQVLYAFHYTTLRINKFQGFFFLVSKMGLYIMLTLFFLQLSKQWLLLSQCDHGGMWLLETSVQVAPELRSS